MNACVGLGFLEKEVDNAGTGTALSSLIFMITNMGRGEAVILILICTVEHFKVSLGFGQIWPELRGDLIRRVG